MSRPENGTAPLKLASRSSADPIEDVRNYSDRTDLFRQRPIRRRRRRRRHPSQDDVRVLQLLAVIRDGSNEDNVEAAIFDVQNVGVPPSRIRALFA
jgi:hypothetical protein